VLTDRAPLTQRTLGGGIVGHHIWRFADLATRLEFLLAGFGWCNMPVHMVADHIAAGRLKRLETAEHSAIAFRIHVVHERGRQIGSAGRWLIADLRARIKGPACKSHRHKLESQGLVAPQYVDRDEAHAPGPSPAADDDLVPALAESATD
jgi:hypothetical protein